MSKAVSTMSALVVSLALVSGCDGGGDDTGRLDAKDGGKSGSGSFEKATATALDGTFYFLAPDEEGAAVWTFTDGGKPKKLVSGDANMWTTANPSPDGKYLSHVDLDSELHIVDTATGDPIELTVANVEPYCREPVWSPDSTRLLVHENAVESRSPSNWIAIDSGTATEADSLGGCHVRYGPDSPDDVYGHVAGDLSGVILREGADETVIDGDAVPERIIVDLVSMARDNAAMCVATVDPAEPTGDAARSLTCDTIVDTGSGEPVELPGSVHTALFPASGGILRQTVNGDLVLSDRDDDAIATLALPDGILQPVLLGYHEAR